MKIIDYYSSPTGLLEIVANDKGIQKISFVKKRVKTKPNSHTKECKKQLREYFAGKRKRFNLQTSVDGTVFENKVWKSLLKVNFGDTVTYGKLAKKAGYPGSARAVGNAMNKNPLCIIVPCHRVVGVSSKYNYAAGSAKKKWLLNHES